MGGFSRVNQYLSHQTITTWNQPKSWIFGYKYSIVDPTFWIIVDFRGYIQRWEGSFIKTLCLKTRRKSLGTTTGRIHTRFECSEPQYTWKNTHHFSCSWCLSEMVTLFRAERDPKNSRSYPEWTTLMFGAAVHRGVLTYWDFRRVYIQNTRRRLDVID